MCTGLVGMCSDAVVRNTCSYPYGTFLPRAFADDIHNPNLIRVAEREGLTLAGIAVLLDQRGHALDSLASRLAALQSNVDKASVIDAYGIPELLQSSPCRLTDGELVLVGVADNIVGVCYLRDGA